MKKEANIQKIGNVGLINLIHLAKSIELGIKKKKNHKLSKSDRAFIVHGISKSGKIQNTVGESQEKTYKESANKEKGSSEISQKAVYKVFLWNKRQNKKNGT